MATSRIIGRGWAFPVRPTADGRVTLIAGEEKIKQSIWLILSTSPGERLMLPEFGCSVHDLVYSANTTALLQDVERRVMEALVQWEPRIDVLDVRAEAPAEARNTLLLRIDYRVRDSNAFYNLIYPLYINEGPG